MSAFDPKRTFKTRRACDLRKQQLTAFKDGTRKHSGATSHTDIMNVIQLSAQDIANVAAYFASQPCAAMGAKSRPE